MGRQVQGRSWILFDLCIFMLYNNLTWTALLIKVARSLIWHAFCLGCWQIYILCICNGNSTHGKGTLLRWKPMQNDLQDNEPCWGQKGRTNPPTAALSCHVMPCQCSKATGEEVPRVECKFMSLVKYRPAMLCSGRNMVSKIRLENAWAKQRHRQ